MDEKLKVYDDKMTKTINNLEVSLQPSAQDVPIHMYWIS